jgi:hypothetical protein
MAVDLYQSGFRCGSIGVLHWELCLASQSRIQGNQFIGRRHGLQNYHIWQGCFFEAEGQTTSPSAGNR